VQHGVLDCLQNYAVAQKLNSGICMANVPRSLALKRVHFAAMSFVWI
jgi:hypothetical protein